MTETTSQESPQDWFTRLITETLKRYAKNASTDYLVKKYPGLPKDIIAQKYIVQQARMTSLAGAASAAVVSGATIGSLALVPTGVGIPALAITIPVGIVAFLAEVSYTVRLQIRTAYDLYNLYGLQVNLDDPEDVQEIFAIGLGIKAGEVVGNVIQRLAPNIATQQVRSFMRKGIRRAIQNWVAKNLSRTIAAKYLTEKFLLNTIVPGISILLAAGWNYYFTKGLGGAVQLRVRGRGISAEYINAIQLPAQANPELLLATALNIMMADSRVSVAFVQLTAELPKTAEKMNFYN